MGETIMFTQSLEIDEEIEQLVQQGNAEALFKKGFRFEQHAKAQFEQHHTVEALRWMQQAMDFYHRSANRGYSEAHYHLGRIYDEGRYGISNNVELALRYYESAADLGIAEGANNAAIIYLGNAKNEIEQSKRHVLYAKAATWLQYLGQLATHSTEDLTDISKESEKTLTSLKKALSGNHAPIPRYQHIPIGLSSQVSRLPTQSLIDKFYEERQVAGILQQHVVSKETYQAALAKKEQFLIQEQEQLWRTKNTVQLKTSQVAQESLETERLLQTLGAKSSMVEDGSLAQERALLEKKKAKLDKLKSDLLDEKTLLEKKQQRLNEDRYAFEQDKQYIEDQLLLQQEKMEATLQTQRQELEKATIQLKTEATVLTQNKERFQNEYREQLIRLQKERQQIEQEKQLLRMEKEQAEEKIGRPSTAEDERARLEQRIIQIEQQLREKESQLERDYQEKEKKLKQTFEHKMSQLEKAQRALDERKRELEEKDSSLQQEKKFYQNVEKMIDEKNRLDARIEKGREKLKEMEQEAKKEAQRIEEEKELISKLTKRNPLPLLIHLVQYANAEVEVLRLIELGQDVNIQDTQQRTALHWAVLSQQSTLVQALMTGNTHYSANPNVQDAEGRTPLHLAVRALETLETLDELKLKLACLGILLAHKGKHTLSLLIKDTDGARPLQVLPHGLLHLGCTFMIKVNDSDLEDNHLYFYLKEPRRGHAKLHYQTKTAKGEKVLGEISRSDVGGQANLIRIIDAIKENNLSSISETDKKKILTVTTMRGHTFELCWKLIGRRHPSDKQIESAVELILATIESIQTLRARTDAELIHGKQNHGSTLNLSVSPNPKFWLNSERWHISDNDIDLFWANSPLKIPGKHPLLYDMSLLALLPTKMEFSKLKEFIQYMSRAVLQEANDEQWRNYIKLFYRYARHFMSKESNIKTIIDKALLHPLNKIAEIPLESHFHTHLMLGDVYFEIGNLEEALDNYMNAQGYAYHLTQRNHHELMPYQAILLQLSKRFLVIEAIGLYKILYPLLTQEESSTVEEELNELWQFWENLEVVIKPLYLTQQHALIKQLFWSHQHRLEKLSENLLLKLNRNKDKVEIFKQTFESAKQVVIKCNEFGLSKVAKEFSSKLRNLCENKPSLANFQYELTTQIAPVFLEEAGPRATTAEFNFNNSASAFLNYRSRIAQARFQLLKVLRQSPIENIFQVQEQFSKNILEIVKDILTDVVNKLNVFIKPPCDFCFTTIGSGQRGTLFPASDIDCHILIDNAQYRSHPYFRKLIELFKLQMALVEAGDLTGNKAIKFPGFHLDSGDFTYDNDSPPDFLNTPDALSKKLESLINRLRKVDVVTSKLGSEERAPELSSQLMSQLLYSNNIRGTHLWETYQQFVISQFDEKIKNNQSIRTRLAAFFIHINYAWMTRDLSDHHHSQQKTITFDIKEAFLNPLSYLTLFLSMAYGCQTQNLCQVFMFLKTKKIMAPELVECIHLALATIHQFRCAAHLTANSAVDAFGVKESFDSNKFLPFEKHLISSVDYQLLFDIDQLLTRPFYEYAIILVEKHTREDAPLPQQLTPAINYETLKSLINRLKQPHIIWEEIHMHQDVWEKTLQSVDELDRTASKPTIQEPLFISDEDAVPDLPESDSDKDNAVTLRINNLSSTPGKIHTQINPDQEIYSSHMNHPKLDEARLKYHDAKGEFAFGDYKEAYKRFLNAKTFFKDAKQELGEHSNVAKKLEKIENYLEQCKQRVRK